MRKSGLPVPVAALLSGVIAAGAVAQETVRDPIKLPPGPVVAAKEAPRAGNPLWAIPLGELSETQARPLFSLSRRPAAVPVAVALPVPPPHAGPPSKREPDHPSLTLLGTIVGESVEIGVFVDEASHDVIRLKTGEAHDGWTLHAVAGRAATFEKEGSRAATLVLPAPRAEAAAASGGGANPVANPVAITVAPPVIQLEPQVIPSTTRGGAKRPPKEG
jgi:general secretion pathway protein N